MCKIEFPSRQARIRQWCDLYTLQGQRWGLHPSLTAHFALWDIATFNGHCSTLIDIGCGYGRDLLLFRAVFPELQLDGLEPAPPAVKAAESIMPLLALRSLYTQDFFSFAHRGCALKYDVVFANYFLHLFSPEEAVAIMKRVSTILTPSGLAVFSFVSQEDRHWGKGRRISPKTYEVRKGIPWRFMNRQDVETLCVIAGMRVRRMEEFREVESIQRRPDPVKGIYLVAESAPRAC